MLLEAPESIKLGNLSTKSTDCFEGCLANQLKQATPDIPEPEGHQSKS
jgi:hypothetical protein